MLKVSNLSAAYGKVQVLWSVGLEVAAGEIVAIVGANGAGKTTLLRTISGLLKLRAGEVLFGGDLVSQKTPNAVAELGIIHIPEGRRMFAEMTVLENLELGSYNSRARPERAASLDRVFRIFPVLAQKRRALAGSLSGGEQQMLAIGRGLMARPKLLMLDEPSLGLAPVLVEELFAVLARINREEGMTILLVEQNVQYALEHLAQRGYVLENGRVVLSGPSEDLLGNPHVRAAYLGI